MAGDPRSVPRLELARLARGDGRYLDDLPVPGALSAVFVRSPHAHAVIRDIDPQRALAVDGVHAVYTASDLRRIGAGRLRIGWAVPGQHGVENELLTGDRVRYVGDPVAVVVASDPAIAEDAAALVSVRYEPLPAVVDVDGALAPAAPLLHPAWGENVTARVSMTHGDARPAFAHAAHVIAERLRVGRATGVPLEPRGAVAQYTASGEFELITSTQSPHHARDHLATAIGCPVGSLRVIAPDVGGSFGVKDHACAEEAIVCLVARDLRSPVKWVQDRYEAMVAAAHSREQVWDLELAADVDGRVLAVRGRLLFDGGAYNGNHGIGTALYSATVLPGLYDFQHYDLEVVGVATNKPPSAAYRGYGAPEATFVMESLMERLARRLDADPADVRRANLIGDASFPYRTVGGCLYDQGAVSQAFERALELAGYRRHRARTARSSGRIRRGLGIACGVLMGGFGPSRAAVASGMTFGGYETGHVRMDASGHATVLTGISTQGQGIETALAQCCAEPLGLDPTRDVSVVAGDTGRTPFSPVGAIASRGAAVGGSAVRLAAEKLAAKLRGVAAALLNVEPHEVTLADGRAHAPDGATSISVGGLARRLELGEALPPEMEPGLEAIATYDPSDETYSYTVQAAVVAVDTATGAVTVERYVAVCDCGRLINPGIVVGQVQGGVVQGIGGALMEELAYAADGTPLATTLYDYVLPTAADVPAVEVELLETPTATSVTGARGAGEIGIIGPTAAIANAIADALTPEGRMPSQVPLTPSRVAALLAAAEVPEPRPVP